MFPQSIHSSGLFGRIRDDGELLNALDGLRSIAARLAETVSRSVPGFTDHSIQHMDALWAVTDRVLTPSEVGMLTPGEAFLLAAGFYLHDIGMAYAATDEGLRRCRASTYYEDFVARMPESRRTHGVDAQAIAVAVRRLHAGAAIELATSVVPGTSVYLFESLAFREAWGETAGRVAASHHWGLEQIDRDLGAGGAVPLPGGRKGDLAYVACVLRIVDYAHINRERAPTIDRAFRGAINQESLVHWLAQENVDGPERENDELIYRAARPIADVEAWWLYFEMLSGLDAEIRAVRRYLDRRPNCRSRLSLQGVRGAASPQEAATYIEPGDFLPIEVNLRTGSIDRLVQLLAGESLYGPDPMAAVRELVQNARDAVELKATIDLSEADRAALALPIRLTLSSDDSGSYLEVVDWGVGMTQKVMTDYLIAIASDYWTSQFYTDFPKATERGFQPAGKFGIGFLSVFMLGDEITVESNRSGGERSALTLRGVGRRGELRRLGPAPGSGTKVHVRLKDSVSRISANLPELVRVYAPMLNHTLVVEADGSRTEIPQRWLFSLSADEFRTWTLDAVQALSGRGGDRYVRGTSLMPYYSRGRGDEIWGTGWPDYQEQSARLVASLSGSSLLCLKGLALQAISTPGFVGVIDVESAVPNVSRRQALQADVTDVLRRAKAGTHAQIVQHLDNLAKGLLIDKLRFLGTCISLYGSEVLRDSSVPWIGSLRLPGTVELLSSRELLVQLAKKSSLFIAFGAEPWSAMRKWVRDRPPALDAEIAIALDGTDDDPNYRMNDDTQRGSLAELLPNYTRTSLLNFILLLAAEAWQMNLAEFGQQGDWEHHRDVISGRLTRK